MKNHKIDIYRQISQKLIINLIVPGFDSRWERCKNRASRPSQGTVNGGPVGGGGAVSK